ncbi:A24 family peptidase [Vibrio sp. VB16]|uniref:A24 family peptidase n=1 Tax=Vibrio sp. VB16 TaxID=2785746 RepID=UPI00189FF0E9|nr:prepilin peptidase [Vibrio sp. VB16]UGA54222.1 A24 family peptidase [Vibrio sp. VB16]
MTVISIIIFVTTTTLIYVIQSDFRKKKIPNTASVLLLINSTLYCGFNGYWMQWLIVVPVFLFGLLLWRLSIWGAGDAKLLAGVSPMISLDHFVATLLLIAFLGGALSVVIFVSSRLKKNRVYIHIPYGIPISIGCWLGIIASIP